MKKLLFILCIVSTVTVSAQSRRVMRPTDNQIKETNAKRALTKQAELPAKRTVVPVTGKQLEINKAREAQGVVSDTRFHCVKGDWSSPVPGSCPKHKSDLLKDTDPNIGELVYEAQKADPNYGMNHQDAEDHAYICMEGDMSSYGSGKCPNHPASDMLSIDDANTVKLMQAAVKKNPDHFSKMVKPEDIQFACIHTDYVDFKPGKCPTHNLDLVSTLNKAEFIQKSAAVNVKKGTETK